jgi:hypothetical protein
MGRLANHPGELRRRIIAINTDGHLQTPLNPLAPSQDDANQARPLIVSSLEAGVIYA